MRLHSTLATYMPISTWGAYSTRPARSNPPRRTIDRLSQRTPSRPWRRSIWAWRWRILRGRGEAIEAYQRALRFEPNTAAAHYNLSRLYEEKGLTKEALRHLADYKRLI